MSWRIEFPQFGTMPTIPEGFEDTSWHNDSCPSFTSPATGLRLWIAEAVPAEREYPDHPRFTLEHYEDLDTDSNGRVLITTDAWDEVLAIITHRAGNV